MEEKEKVIKEFFKDSDNITVLSISNINHKPHPFTIGSEHIQRYALDMTKGCAMRVNGDKWSIAYKKGYTKCGLSYEEHTYDTVVFIQLKQNVKGDILQQELKLFIDKFGEDYISGFTFVETNDKFRIL